MPPRLGAGSRRTRRTPSRAPPRRGASWSAFNPPRRAKESELPLLHALCLSGLVAMSTPGGHPAAAAPLDEDKGQRFSARDEEVRRQIFAEKERLPPRPPPPTRPGAPPPPPARAPTAHICPAPRQAT